MSLLRLLLLLLLLTRVLLQIKYSSRNNSHVGCVRHTKYHFIVKDNYTLNHLTAFNSLTQRLLKAHSISNLTATVVRNSLHSSTHNLCKLKDLPNRIKRQVLIAALGGIISGLSLPAIVSAIIHPSSSTLPPEYLNFIEKTRSITRRNSQLLFSLQRRLDRVEAKEEANELLLTVLQALKTEEKKFLELSQRNWRYSTMLYGLLKQPLKYYSKIGLLSLDPGTHRLDERLPLPEKAFHLNVTTTSAENCKDARIDITLYAPLPSTLCETVVSADENFIMTKIKGPKNECRVLPPLYNLVELQDGSHLSPYNSFIVPNCEPNNFTFTFNAETSTLYAVPRTRGAIISSCGGIHRATIEGGRGISPALGCSSWLSSGHLSPSVHDLYSSSAWILNERGDFIDAGPLSSSNFLFLEENYDTSTSPPATPSTSTTINQLDHIAPANTHSRDTILITVTALFVLACLSLAFVTYRKCLARRQWYNPQQARRQRFSISDIEVRHRSIASVDSKLGKLADLNREFASISNPTTKPKPAGTYNVELIPMPTLRKDATLDETASFSSSNSTLDTDKQEE